jgi:hypothetical protein
MVNISELSPGMRVKIVDEWILGRTIGAPEMNRFLGTIGTVKEIKCDSIWIEEDEGSRDDGTPHWFWYSYMLDYIVYEDEGEFEPATAEELKLMLFSH